MSLGTRSTYEGTCDSASVTNLDLKDSVDRIRRNGGVVTVSTGNDGLKAIQSPACLSNTIAVGNADTVVSDAPRPFWSSNGGSGLDLFAPGTDIVSAYRGETDSAGRPVGSTALKATGTMTGTSMAAPHVAGAIALIRQLHPKAPVEVVERCLRSDTKRMIPQYGMSRPMLDVPAAIACVASAANPTTKTIVLRLGDTFFDASKPTNSYGSASVLEIDSSPSVKRTYFKPRDWTGLPSGARLQSAQLVVQVVNGESPYGVALFPTGADGVYLASMESGAAGSRPFIRVTYK